MTKHLSEKQEQELSERFDLGVRGNEANGEDRVFRSYGRIQNGVRSLGVPEVDAATLSRRLAKEMGHRGKWFEGWHFPVVRVPRPVFVSLCLVFALAGLAGPGKALLLSHPVALVKFAAQSPRTGESVPFLWEHRLQQGSVVTVPEGFRAELNLSDGSTVSCAPHTQIAIHMDDRRHIILNSGEMTIRAAHIPDSTLNVKTPLGTVAVVGTVFRVKIVR